MEALLELDEPLRQKVLEYIGPSFKDYIREVYEVMDKYPQCWRFGIDAPLQFPSDEPVVEAPSVEKDVFFKFVEAPRMKKEDAVFWEARWAKSMPNDPYYWCGGEFGKVEFTDGSAVIWLNPYSNRFERLILSEEGTSAIESFTQTENRRRNTTPIAKVNIEDIVDSPEAIKIMSDDSRVEKAIEQLHLYNLNVNTRLKCSRRFSIFPFAPGVISDVSAENRSLTSSFSAFHSQYNLRRRYEHSLEEEKLLSKYNGDPTILYIWTIQTPYRRVSTLFNPETSEVLYGEHVKYELTKNGTVSKTISEFGR